ncbi:MAG: 2'-deoxycytidine 5'-triphosphate deaminase domain-containing protein [Minisyncoccota bacterium]
MKYGGALSAELIHELLGAGFISSVPPGNVRCGSIDLGISDEAYRVEGAFLPQYHETVKDAIKRMGGIKIPASTILDRGLAYVFRLETYVNSLAEDVYGYCNPKSSTGRVDVHVRLLADKVSRYDAVPRGYSGPLWVLVVPKTFPVILPQGMALNQLRLFTQDTRFDEFRLQTQMSMNGGLINLSSGEPIQYGNIRHSDKDGSVILSLGLQYDYPGFEAIDTNVPLDLGEIDHYDPKKFFRPVLVQNNSLTLSAGTFYILSTMEYVRVPAHLACEMVPMDERSGDLRSHYAGFIDPGWGICSDSLGRGRPLTLEVRSFDTALTVCNGQPIAKIRYERMMSIPAEHYDQMSAHYTSQSGPKFGKFFKEWS